MTLYVLTDERRIPSGEFHAVVEAALDGGAGMVQFREKLRPPSESVDLGRDLRVLCTAYGVPLIVNDSAELAAAVRADGVHLGGSDGSIAEARRVLGRNALIGVSCYDSVERAVAAQNEGAAYVAFGACFPSTTKPNAVAVPLEVLRQAHETLDIPVCGIGGIDAGNVAELVSIGVDMVAVCDAVFGGPDVRDRARRMKRAMQSVTVQVPQCRDPNQSSSDDVAPRNP